MQLSNAVNHVGFKAEAIVCRSLYRSSGFVRTLKGKQDGEVVLQPRFSRLPATNHCVTALIALASSARALP